MQLHIFGPAIPYIQKESTWLMQLILCQNYSCRTAVVGTLLFFLAQFCRFAARPSHGMLKFSWCGFLNNFSERPEKLFKISHLLVIIIFNSLCKRLTHDRHAMLLQQPSKVVWCLQGNSMDVTRLCCDILNILFGRKPDGTAVVLSSYNWRVFIMSAISSAILIRLTKVLHI